MPRVGIQKNSSTPSTLPDFPSAHPRSDALSPPPPVPPAPSPFCCCCCCLAASILALVGVGSSLGLKEALDAPRSPALPSSASLTLLVSRFAFPCAAAISPLAEPLSAREEPLPGTEATAFATASVTAISNLSSNASRLLFSSAAAARATLKAAFVCRSSASTA